MRYARDVSVVRVPSREQLHDTNAAPDELPHPQVLKERRFCCPETCYNNLIVQISIHDGPAIVLATNPFHTSTRPLWVLPASKNGQHFSLRVSKPCRVSRTAIDTKCMRVGIPHLKRHPSENRRMRTHRVTEVDVLSAARHRGITRTHTRHNTIAGVRVCVCSSRKGFATTEWGCGIGGRLQKTYGAFDSERLYSACNIPPACGSSLSRHYPRCRGHIGKQGAKHYPLLYGLTTVSWLP